MPENQKHQHEKNILIVDDDDDILNLLENWLLQEAFRIQTAKSGEEAMSTLSAGKPDLVITDLFMDGMSGMQLLTTIHAEDPLLPIIMLSGKAQIQDALRATHLGCSAFLTKPIDQEELISQVNHALKLSTEQNDSREAFSHVIYQSRQMAELIELAEYIADSNVTVFISGATGTGKEIIARAIHRGSPRRDYPFIPVNCGAIPEHLLESELFGHEKGAFTGASTRYEGLFMAANGGTLFLDEIGDMPLALQVKLLRVLQDLEVRPVGSVKSYPVDIRIISASHMDLEKAVEEGKFREDLYYRLKVVPLHMPGLEERREDIPVLADYFLKKYAVNNRKQTKQFAPPALEYLSVCTWPGNIRQLINVVDLCATLARGNIIPLSIVKRALKDKPRHIQTLKEARQDFEKQYLVSILRITNGHVANAAKIAGRNRTEFYKLLNQHNLDAAKFRQKK